MQITQDEFIERLNVTLSGGGLTQYRLSKDTGVSQSAISRIRKGSMKMTLKTAEKLAGRLGFVAAQALTFEPIRDASASAGCPVCGQVVPDAQGIGGEYPCLTCGVPTLHDSPECNHEWVAALGSSVTTCTRCGARKK